MLKSVISGQLAGWSWRSKLGRPASLHKLGDADVTGSYCLLPEDWLNKKFGTYPLWQHFDLQKVVVARRVCDDFAVYSVNL